MRRVVSVSLGSKKGDKTATATFLGEEFEVSRVSCGGDLEKAAEMIRDLDGKVDAIGLGGIDRYLVAGNRKYAIRDAERMMRYARQTPVVDGSGIKDTLEREAILYLQDNGIFDFRGKNALVVCAVDRFGTGETIYNLAKATVFGDLMFNVGAPIPVRSWGAIQLLGRILLPVVTRLPFKWLYPTGDKQDKITPKHEKYFRWADVIAGDYKIIGRFMPPPESGAMAGKTVITNTLTEQDKENLKARGVSMVVTSTFELDGRNFGTNVVEGVLITLAGKRPEEMTREDYLELIRKLEWKPTVYRFAGL
ncbi:MAG: quinate 5-dehydrogenase [Armatimonadota bacterium]|nr:quinate 5-dehydrogenase [Armatimonadota bacterium]